MIKEIIVYFWYFLRVGLVIKQIFTDCFFFGTASQTEIALESSDFSQTYQTSSGFLNGQTLITKITAIQIMQDQLGISPTTMAVFGLGADGMTPYVGFVNMLDPSIAASPLVPVGESSVSVLLRLSSTQSDSSWNITEWKIAWFVFHFYLSNSTPSFCSLLLINFFSTFFSIKHSSIFRLILNNVFLLQWITPTTMFSALSGC